MGVAPDQAEAWLAAQVPEGEEHDVDLTEPTEVWPENWPALQLFLKLQTQWHCDAEGHRVGLRYEAMQSAMWMQGVKREERPRLFDNLVEMQHAALEVIHGL